MLTCADWSRYLSAAALQQERPVLVSAGASTRPRRWHLGAANAHSMVRGPFGVCRVTLKPLVTTAARLMSGLCGALAPEVNGALAVACMAVLPMGRKGASWGSAIGRWAVRRRATHRALICELGAPESLARDGDVQPTETTRWGNGVGNAMAQGD